MADLLSHYRYCCTVNKKYMLLCKAFKKKSKDEMAEVSAQVSPNAYCPFTDCPCVISSLFSGSMPFSVCELLWCKLFCRVGFPRSQILGSTCSTGALDAAGHL